MKFIIGTLVNSGDKQYVIQEMKNGNIWITNEINEGIETTEEKLIQAIDKLFNEEL